MEDEQGLESSLSSNNSKLLTFAEFADEMCPYYMQMGVPYNEYWHGDYTQLRHYAEAYKLKIKQDNYNAWLQGAYIYDALCAVSPVLNAFAKKGTKPTPYHNKPYGEDDESNENNQQTTKTEKTKEEIQAINASAKFSSFVQSWNKRFEKGGENIAN